MREAKRAFNFANGDMFYQIAPLYKKEKSNCADQWRGYIAQISGGNVRVRKAHGLEFWPDRDLNSDERSRQPLDERGDPKNTWNSPL